MMCYICGGEVQSAQKYEDLIGNKIYICGKCGKSREHRVLYKYRRPATIKVKEVKGNV